MGTEYPVQAEQKNKAPEVRFGAPQALALIVLAFGISGSLWYQRTRSLPPDAEKRIATGLSKTNSWHFSGWKMIGGRKTTWEVWGRRQPPLFYERVGDNQTYGDSSKFMKVYGGGSARQQIVVYDRINIELYLRTDLANTPYYQIIHSSHWDGQRHPNRQVSERTREQVVYSEPVVDPLQQEMAVTTHYTISRRTWQPVQYRRHYQSEKEEYDSEFLTADYNVPIPGDIAPTVGSAADILDYRRVERPGTTLQEMTSPSGLRVRAVPLAVDRDGNLLIQIKGTSGRYSLPSLSDAVAQELSILPRLRLTIPLVEMQDKTKFLYHIHSEIRSTRGADTFLLSPLEPAGQKPRRPRRLRLLIGVDLGTHREIPGTAGKQRSQSALAYDYRRSESFQQTVEIPQAGLPQHFRPYLSTMAIPQQDLLSPEASLQFQIYKSAGLRLQRSQEQPMAALPNAETREARRRQLEWSAEWLQKALALLPQEGATRYKRMEVRLALGHSYREMGRQDLAEDAWRRAIKEAQALPAEGDRYRSAAEQALKTGEVPVFF